VQNPDSAYHVAALNNLYAGADPNGPMTDASSTDTSVSASWDERLNRVLLPADRGELFNLLQSMEKSGGWPYIPRLQLRTFMDLLQSGEAGTALAA